MTKNMSCKNDGRYFLYIIWDHSITSFKHASGVQGSMDVLYNTF